MVALIMIMGSFPSHRTGRFLPSHSGFPTARHCAAWGASTLLARSVGDHDLVRVVTQGLTDSRDAPNLGVRDARTSVQSVLFVKGDHG